MSKEELDVMFTPREIKMVYVVALSHLVTECEKNNVEIKSVKYFQHGFSVVFKDMPGGDAVIHDNSYARDWGYFETLGMPWDYDDVSTHDPETLAKLIRSYLDGKDWKELDK
jgi:hypothetical protein